MLLILAVSALLAPWIAAAIGAVTPGAPSRGARLAATVTGLGFLAVVALTVVVMAGGTPAPQLGGELVAARFDALALILALLVLGLATVIQSFALRYLRADPRHRWFVVSASALTGSTMLMLTASSVLLFALAWLAAGVALVLLLNTYPRLEQARTGVRRTARRFAVGDAALVLAVTTLLILGGPTLALNEVGAVFTDAPGWLAVTLGLLLVAPALARSSQIPFQGWLPATLAAPTPVSALLHAGVVNSGAILLIRFSSGLAESAIVMGVIFAAGAATVVAATAVRLVKPDVKGRLVFSTMGQMGFMIMACGLGAFAAAIFHMVAHGLYKSTLFLSAGSGIRRRAVQRAWPDRQTTPLLGTVVVAALAVLVSVVVVAGARATVAPDISAASLALLAFVIITGAVTSAATLRARLSVTTAAVTLTTLVVLVLAYTATVAAVETLLPPIAATGAVSAWWVLAPALMLVVVQACASPRTRTPFTAGIIDRVYVRSLSASIPRLTLSKGI